MKNIMVLSVFILIWALEGAEKAQAFYLQDSIEVSLPHHSPYPYVFSQPIDILPQGYVSVNVGYDTYYYYDGVFYQKIMRDQKYAAVPPPVGAVVFAIPLGYQLMFIDEVSYYEYKGVYYKRVLDGYRVTFPPV